MERLAFPKANPSCGTILVEKTDRLYRNIRDWITVDHLDLTVQFVKENAVVSKDSRSSEKFMHGVKVLMTKNSVDYLSEEVKKGLREKAEQGHWPGMDARQNGPAPRHEDQDGTRTLSCDRTVT